MAQNPRSRRIAPFPIATVEGVASILGATDDGLSNGEIANVLSAIRLSDPRAEAEASNPAVRQGLMWVRMSKRERIATALRRHQERDGTGKALVAFINETMNPRRYTGNLSRHRCYQDALNQVLVLDGLRVNDEGKVARGPKASTLSEAARIAGTLTTELRRRDAHDSALRHCTEEIIARDVFHAVHEAVKGICDRLRQMTGSSADGHDLVDLALTRKGGSMPLVRLNALETQTDWSEQNGLANLIRGLISRYRNPTAHQTRLSREAERPIVERELLEILTTVSLIHHALDTAFVSEEKDVVASSVAIERAQDQWNPNASSSQ